MSVPPDLGGIAGNFWGLKGYPNKTIAAVLEISTWTIGTHLRRMFAKFGVNSRAAMVAQLIHLHVDE